MRFASLLIPPLVLALLLAEVRLAAQEELPEKTAKPSCEKIEKEIPQVANDPHVRLVAAGDTMMGSELRKGKKGLAPGNGEKLFAGVKKILAGADIAFLNLEGPLADDLPQQKCRPESVSCYAFRTPSRYVAALLEAGIDVVNLANNHAMDLGMPGMESSMAVLDKASIAHAGRVGDIARLERHGVKISFVAANFGSCCLNVNQIEEIICAIQAEAENSDIVVLSMHAGAEGSKARHVPGQVETDYGELRGDVKLLAHAAVDAGADLVLGHGPHVLRAIEVYQGRLIAYSLGNFMGFRQFGIGGGYGGHSVILEVELSKNGVLVAAKLHAVRLDDQGVPRLDPRGTGLKHIRELCRQDFPDSGASVQKNGTLRWKAAQSTK